jgi:oxygen-independent coproporphyrinogen-3 oxidase
MIGGVHYQNNAKWEGYLESIAAGQRPIYRGLAPSDDERLIRETILQLKLGQLDQRYFARKFGVDLLARFAEPFARLRGWGFLTVDGDHLRLNRDGLLQVDRLLHEFFLPQHRDIRYT